MEKLEDNYSHIMMATYINIFLKGLQMFVRVC